MVSHQRHLRRGLSWLGGATAITKAIDFGVILAVLLFLTKRQLGVASLVVAMGAVIEAVNGIGTSAAVIQAPSITKVQLDTLFWFLLGTALLIGGLTLAVAEPIATFYGVSGMATFFIAIALKQPFVGAALIPIALLNRDLQYERIAIVDVASTFATALTRLGLAVAGTGAWAIVGAYAASGLYTMVGVWLARPFRPRLAARPATIVPLLRFGASAVTSDIFEQMFNNVHYLLVGWLYGTAALAVYRVAFTIAMEPAIAIGALINRAALPVFAQVARVKEQLAEVFLWLFGKMTIAVAPLLVATILAATPLTAMIHDEHGASYAAAALPLMLLAGAAFFRVLAQLLYPIVLGSGRPGTAAALSVWTFVLSSAGILGAGLGFSRHLGIVAIGIVWVALYPPVLAWEARYLRRHWKIRGGAFLRSLGAPCAAIAILIGGIRGVEVVLGRGEPKLLLAMILTITVLVYAGLFLSTRQGARPAA